MTGSTDQDIWALEGENNAVLEPLVQIPQTQPQGYEAHKIPTTQRWKQAQRLTYSARNGCSSSSAAIARLSGSGSKHLQTVEKVSKKNTN